MGEISMLGAPKYGEGQGSQGRWSRTASRRSIVAVLSVAALAVSGCGSSGSGGGGAASTSVVGSTAPTSSGGGGGSASSSTTSAPVSTSATTTATAPAGTTTGLTATTIDIGVVADVTGPVPGIFQGSEYAMQAWAAAVNASGGLDGRKVNLVFKDSGLNCNLTTNDITGLESSTFADVGNYALFDVCAQPFLTSHSTYPVVEGYVLNSSLEKLANVFSPLPSPPGFQSTGYVYAKDQVGGDVSHVGALYFASSEEAFKEQSNAAKSVGYKYLYTRGVGASETIFTSDILRMKADGINVVDLTDLSTAGVADFLQQAKQQSFAVKAVINTSAYDPQFLKEIGTVDPSVLYMPILLAPYLNLTTTVANLQNYQKYLAKLHPGTQPSLFGAESYLAGLLFQQAFEAAGPSPTRESLLAALKGIKHFDAGGMSSPSNPGDKVPAYCTVEMGVRNGQFVQLSPSGVGFECNGSFVDYP